MMNAVSHAASAESIAHALKYEVETLTQVVETLGIEHKALMVSDAERLEQAVAAKQRAITHAQARHEREKLGLKEGLRAQVLSHPGLFNGLRDGALACVDELREKGEASKGANQRKGMLIAGLR